MAALGGNLPPIFWDGAGGADHAPQIDDNVAALNLGVTDPAAGLGTANPKPLPRSKKLPKPLPAIKLPESMEAVVR